MATSVFCSGHGGWKPSYGFTKVPKGIKVHFYTHHAKNLITGMEYQILRGEYTEIERTYEEYRSCPNMRLSHQDASWTQKTRDALRRGKRDGVWGRTRLVTASAGHTKSLEQILEVFSQRIFRDTSKSYEVHWLACSTLQLARVGGRAYGVNAGDFKHDSSRSGRYRIRANAADGIVMESYLD